MDFFRLLNTVKYLKPVQVYSRIWFRLYRPAPDWRPAPGKRVASGSWTTPADKPRRLLSSWRFRFLNREHECDFPAAWNREEWGKLWLYNLHYFDCLSDVGRQKQQAELISRWIADNPPGYGSGWEPYPLSLRIVNWIKWCLAGNKLSGEALESLAVQVRFLRKRLEFHLLGNHLFANGKALVFAGLFFAGDEAESWLAKGMEILWREIPEQVLADGGHFERSPMYHAIIFEDILDLVNLFRVYGRDVPDSWREAAAKMGRWLKVMSHPDGDIALFNDAALGIAAGPTQLFAYFHRLFGKEVGGTDNRGCWPLSQSGYYVMAPVAGGKLLIDCGEIGPDYQPGHAHCDLLSFELSLFGRRVIVDSGCGIYVDGEMRRYNRGNAGHNTVTVDGRDQSEVWGAHRCGRRARPLDARLGEEDGALVFRGAHDGYRHLPGGVTHRREIFWPGKNIEIRDQVDGAGRHRVSTRLHVNPELSVSRRENAVVVELGSGRRLIVESAGNVPVVMEDGFYCPEFGRFLSCPVLVWDQEAELPFRGGWRLTIES